MAKTRRGTQASEATQPAEPEPTPIPAPTLTPSVPSGPMSCPPSTPFYYAPGYGQGYYRDGNDRGAMPVGLSQYPSVHTHAQPPLHSTQPTAPPSGVTFQAGTGSSSGPVSGRREGQKNISEGELDILFSILLEVKPHGPNMWNNVALKYNIEAQKQGFPPRTLATLRRKLNKLIREAGGTKPTGQSHKSWRLQKAFEVDWAIREKYGCAVVDDTAGMEEDEGSDDETQVSQFTHDSQQSASSAQGPRRLAASSHSASQKERWVADKAYKVSQTPVELTSTRGRNSAAVQAISNLASAFDPANVKARDEAKAEQRVLLLQLADAQQELQRLKAENDRLRTALSEAELRAQRAEDRLELEKEKYQFKLEVLGSTRKNGN
ncbi:unnamed protein product [Mycena citricolor]|uniref:DUF6818 domain-containing protein n=1 Tax=Mycena citricolor TaxID=2018698 RepID=A0AAD2HM01_9AGAR|nr:unnamed protein product [Mycena citricolor]CAK5277910.1 unnamed protein product [Mycena citricolor]